VKLDEETDERCEVIEGTLDEHEERLVALERWPWALGIVGALMSPIIVWSLIEIIKVIRAAL
jgi:hypothetical protein